MLRIIAANIAATGFAIALCISWKSLVGLYEADPGQALTLTIIYGGLSLWFAIKQSSAALREARLSALYPRKARCLKHRVDPITEES